MYVNDLPNCSAFKTAPYADDMYLSLSHKNVHVLKDLVNSELANVDKLVRLNKFSINYSKSVYMLTKSMKYFAVLLDWRLSMFILTMYYCKKRHV